MRMGMRRFTRLTNAHSKKIENHAHAIALYFMHYNYCKIHQTLRVTPAMEAELTDHVWEIEELLALDRLDIAVECQRETPLIQRAGLERSLVLCGATIALWVRSESTIDAFQYCLNDSSAHTYSVVDLASESGIIYTDRNRYDFVDADIEELVVRRMARTSPAGISYTSQPVSRSYFNWFTTQHWRDSGVRVSNALHDSQWMAANQKVSMLSSAVWCVQVPYWFIVLLTAVLPLAAIWLYIKRRKSAPGRGCVRSAATISSAPLPTAASECGTIPTEKRNKNQTEPVPKLRGIAEPMAELGDPSPKIPRGEITIRVGFPPMKDLDKSVGTGPAYIISSSWSAIGSSTNP